MNCSELRTVIATQFRAEALAARVAVIRDGGDGQSLVCIMSPDRSGIFAHALAGAGFSVSVENSDNPAFTSLRVR